MTADSKCVRQLCTFNQGILINILRKIVEIAGLFGNGREEKRGGEKEAYSKSQKAKKNK